MPEGYAPRHYSGDMPKPKAPPTCNYVDDEDGACAEPANRRIEIAEQNGGGEAFCCEAHFIHYALVGNSVYGLDGEHAPTFEPAPE